MWVIHLWCFCQCVARYSEWMRYYGCGRFPKLNFMYNYPNTRFYRWWTLNYCDLISWFFKFFEILELYPNTDRNTIDGWPTSSHRKHHWEWYEVYFSQKTPFLQSFCLTCAWWHYTLYRKREHSKASCLSHWQWWSKESNLIFLYFRNSNPIISWMKAYRVTHIGSSFYDHFNSIGRYLIIFSFDNYSDTLKLGNLKFLPYEMSFKTKSLHSARKIIWWKCIFNILLLNIQNIVFYY